MTAFGRKETFLVKENEKTATQTCLRRNKQD